MPSHTLSGGEYVHGSWAQVKENTYTGGECELFGPIPAPIRLWIILDEAAGRARHVMAALTRKRRIVARPEGKLGLGHLKTAGYRRVQRAGGRPILRSIGLPTSTADLIAGGRD
jgi:hypothetical protein